MYSRSTTECVRGLGRSKFAKRLASRQRIRSLHAFDTTCCIDACSCASEGWPDCKLCKSWLEREHAKVKTVVMYDLGQRWFAGKLKRKVAIEVEVEISRVPTLVHTATSAGGARVAADLGQSVPKL